MSFFTVDIEQAKIEAEGPDLFEVVKSNSSFNRAGETFHVVQWKPDLEVPKALVCLVHGYCEHIGEAYEEVARLLSGHGMFVFGHDHVGHGFSTGERVNIKTSFEEDYVGPIKDHCNERKKQFPGVPLVICGHSLGGMMTLLLALEDPALMNLCVLVAPFVEPIPEMATPLNVFMAKWLSSILPSMQSPGSKLVVEHVTRDPEWIDKINDNERFWHGGVKLRQGYKGLLAVQTLASRMNEFRVPVLIQQGTQDKICLPQFAQKLYDNISSTDKELKWYQDAYHDLFIDLEEVRSQTIQDILNWILARMDKL